ncbi:hypothetical protein Tco_1206199 [Tanacetum coccineum]
MLDYGFNFMNTEIYIDYESTICIVKNPVFHSKTKHIEIRHHFIRDSYEKRLNQVIKIHTDHNVADLLTKAFDVSSISNEFRVKTGGCKVNAARQDLVLRGKMRSDLHFNDEDGITFLTNDAVFENLALIGSKSTSWNEFSTNIASAVICLANGQKFNFSKLIFDSMLRNLDTNTKKFLMYPRFLQLFLNNQITLAEPFNDVYQTPAHTKKVFTNMKRKRKDFSRRVTPLFASMLSPPVVEGKGSGQPSKPQPAPFTAQPRIEEQIPVTESSSPRNTQSPRQALQEDTQLP